MTKEWCVNGVLGDDVAIADKKVSKLIEVDLNKKV